MLVALRLFRTCRCLIGDGLISKRASQGLRSVLSRSKPQESPAEMHFPAVILNPSEHPYLLRIISIAVKEVDDQQYSVCTQNGRAVGMVARSSPTAYSFLIPVYDCCQSDDWATMPQTVRGGSTAQKRVPWAFPPAFKERHSNRCRRLAPSAHGKLFPVPAGSMGLRRR